LVVVGVEHLVVLVLLEDLAVVDVEMVQMLVVLELLDKEMVEEPHRLVLGEVLPEVAVRGVQVVLAAVVLLIQRLVEMVVKE
tara:strand:- start:250 stop:495 length:246 start_codon:yes stop_codon:yes gene_type:complete